MTPVKKRKALVENLSVGDARPERLGRLTLAPLNLETALRGAMAVKVPEAEPKGGRPKPKRRRKPKAK
jgi:hypothetical protein